MSLKPGDLFIGVSDFFSIMLPGAILTAALAKPAQDHLFGSIFFPLAGEAQQWTAFLLASYMLGHFAHMIGSGLDKLYDWLAEQNRARAGESDLYMAATRMRVRMLGPHGDVDERKKALAKTYKWTKAFVLLRSPSASAEILRHDADSKFFRSLVVVLLVIGGLQAYDKQWAGVAACAVLAFAAFFRYADQRRKAADQSYIYALALANEPVRKPDGKAGQADQDDE